MKIAFVATYDFATPGGVKNHVCDLAKQLTKQGNDVFIIAPSSQPEITSKIPNFIQIASFPSALKKGSFPPHVLLGLGVISRLQKILTSENFDIVHIQEPLIPPLCLSALIQTKIPLFATFHTYYEKGQPLYKLFRPLLNKWLNQLQGRITVSQPAKSYIEQYFPYDYRVIANGVNIKKFSSPVSKLSCVEADYINLLFIGHAQFKRKGLHYMLEAYRTLKQKHPMLRLIIAGTTWAGRDAPVELVNASLKDVLYLGMISDEELISLYQSADIFCAPSIGNESFGIVLIEAMAAGIPIITTNIEGYASVVRDGLEAVLVPPRDSLALAHAIERLIHNPTLARSLVEQGKVSVQRYSWEKIAKETTDYYVEKINGYT